MKELFIFGDPRFLSGGGDCHTDRSSCEADPTMLTESDETVTTASVIERITGLGIPGHRLAEASVAHTNQFVHHGRDSYHQHEYHAGTGGAGAGFNVFCMRGDAPTAGIELETYVRPGLSIATAHDELTSNWFHFEVDGSLDREYGHELITEVLPPRVYRDIRTWIGLQNVASPWLESWSHSDTGLHVHVGMSQFEGCDQCVCAAPHDRVMLGKWMVALMYMGMVPSALRDRVFLRDNGSYCSVPTDHATSELMRTVVSSRDGVTGRELIDAIIAPKADRTQQWLEVSRGIIDVGPANYLHRADVVRLFSDPSDGTGSAFCGHGVEINFQHRKTIEFRRGKGTMNAVSIHRMVEFCTLLVRYAWKAMREPGDVVSPMGLREFIIENTTSDALRKTVEETWSANGKE